jgi:hypothetical protein
MVLAPLSRSHAVAGRAVRGLSNPMPSPDLWTSRADADPGGTRPTTA